MPSVSCRFLGDGCGRYTALFVGLESAGRFVAPTGFDIFKRADAFGLCSCFAACHLWLTDEGRNFQGVDHGHGFSITAPPRNRQLHDKHLSVAATRVRTTETATRKLIGAVVAGGAGSAEAERTVRPSRRRRMDSRPFKIAAIRAQIESCEAERGRLLEAVTRDQVGLAWISERMDCIQKDLRLLQRDLEAVEKHSEEWN